MYLYGSRIFSDVNNLKKPDWYVPIAEQDDKYLQFEAMAFEKSLFKCGQSMEETSFLILL
jgi:hypothetical protein